MDIRGLYLNRWTSNFDPELDVPNDVPVWMRLPHLPLHCWGDESVKEIGNVVGKYINKSSRKENMHACARICIEVDLGKGLLKAVKIKVSIVGCTFSSWTMKKSHSSVRYVMNTVISSNRCPKKQEN